MITMLMLMLLMLLNTHTGMGWGCCGCCGHFVWLGPKQIDLGGKYCSSIEVEFLRMNIIMFNTVIELSIMANPSFWSPSRIALKDVTAQSQYLLLLIVIVMPNNPIKNDLVIILTMIPEPQHFSLSLLCHCICWHKSWPALIGSHKADLSYSESYSSQEEDR